LFKRIDASIQSLELRIDNGGGDDDDDCVLVSLLKAEPDMTTSQLRDTILTTVCLPRPISSYFGQDL